MKRAPLVFLLALFASGCGRWQARADDLQQSVDAFVASGRKSKSDFVGAYGPPTKCKPTPAGESCVWRRPFGGFSGQKPPRAAAKATERVRAVFDRDGICLSETGSVRRNKRTYRGATEADEEADDAPAGGCQPGEVFEFGRCYADSPGGGPPDISRPNVNEP